jgi:16S rRNA (guanine527-N7)-methyltransferase
VTGDTLPAAEAAVPEMTAPDAHALPPPAAGAVFGPALDGAAAFARILATRGVEQGLIGPHEVPRLWDRHLLNCAVVAELIDDPGGTLVDIGSGAGLPGVVLAMVRPDLNVILLEPMERRCRFLAECVAELGLANASVRRGRAEETTLRADVATARAVAPLDRLAELAVGVVRPGGMVLAIKGRTAVKELEKARPVLRRIGARDARVVRVGQGKVDPATTVVRFFARRGRALGGAQLLPAARGESGNSGSERTWPRLAGRFPDGPDARHRTGWHRTGRCGGRPGGRFRSPRHVRGGGPGLAGKFPLAGEVRPVPGSGGARPPAREGRGDGFRFGGCSARCGPRIERRSGGPGKV